MSTLASQRRSTRSHTSTDRCELKAVLLRRREFTVFPVLQEDLISARTSKHRIGRSAGTPASVDARPHQKKKSAPIPKS